MEGGFLGVLESDAARKIIGHMEVRRRMYIAVFLVGFVVGFPAAGEIIEWLLESRGFIPDGVEVIILQPMEVILLQLRIATQIAFGLTIILVIVDLAWTGRKALPDSLFSAARGMGSFGAMMVMGAIVALGALGLVYAHGILIPFLLEYLAEDSAASGLQSTWQLQSWVGFVTGLYFASIVGFQMPVMVLVLLRTEMVDRGFIVHNRGLIWFSALFIGALISPPDPVSLFLVGGPMLVLLEVALLYEKLTSGRP